MTDLDYSFTESELVDEVRNALAGLDGSKIPDGTIVQTADRFVVPLLNDISGTLNPDEDQDGFDNATVAWTAELSFGAWLTFTRLRDREVESYIDPGQYEQQLQTRTNLSLRQIDASRPPEIPSFHVTVKHDGVNRTVDLQKVWVTE